MTLNEFKSHFYSGRNFIHLNNSGQAPIPDVFKNSLQHWLDRFYSEGAHCSMEGWAQTEITRKKLADFLGAHPSETSFFQTTASALSQAALGIPFQSGDEILTWDQEYPSNFYPWRIAAERTGAQLIQVASSSSSTPAQKILDRVTNKTKAIALSWVQYQAGAVTNLKLISDQLKGQNIWLVADIIQGAGIMPFHFHESGFDIVCGGGHKFLCSGFGSSYMLVKNDRLQDLTPLEYGAMTFGTPDTQTSFTIQPKTAANRFEPGSKSMLEVIAMKASLDLFDAVGISTLHQEALRLAQKLETGLRDLKMRLHSEGGHIINFSSDDPEKLGRIAEKLTVGKVSFAKRGPGIRLSPHAFNHDKDIDQALQLIDSVL